MECNQQCLIQGIGMGDTRVLPLMLDPAFDDKPFDHSVGFGHVLPDIPSDCAIALPGRTEAT
jgi:hypothetical protein